VIDFLGAKLETDWDDGNLAGFSWRDLSRKCLNFGWSLDAGRSKAGWVLKRHSCFPTADEKRRHCALTWPHGA
jgi:hypothetical protein